MDPAAVISHAAMRRAAVQAASAAGVLALAVALAAPWLARAGGTAWVALFPGSVDISVHTGDARVVAGRPLRIVASLSGRGADLLTVIPNLVVSADGQERAVPMHRAGGGFAYTFESIDRSFTYRVAAGKAASAPYSVTALFPPRVTQIDVRYDYPAYTGLQPRDEADAGDIYAPAGTKVRLTVRTDKPLATAALALSGGRQVAMSPADGGAAAEMVLAKEEGYRVRLTDTDGLSSRGDTEYFIRLVDDRPPDVRIVRPSSDQGITPLEEVAVEARADDDYGVARFELVYAVAGREPHVVPFSRLTGTDVERVGAHTIAAEELGVQPGDVITYYARARDVARGKRPTETRSDMFFLEVKPFSEEFVSAQSQAMGGGAASTPLDSLVAAQKEIISATWNLERRAMAGRSPADLKAIAEAQSELTTRVEQMLTRGRRGARGLLPPQQIVTPPQQPPRTSVADPIGSAVEAMGRAVVQLQGERTADALPHEMRALQGLLQAQAEVRRRQVMQQSGAAGQGGSNRADRDLSALFDRELQRQQRTNYESPQQASESSERRDDSGTLDRVRDLARRQEELARRQRDLAAGNLAGDDVKRRLEQLNREQEELQRRTEELERQLQQSGAGQSQRASGARGSGRQQAADLRRAAEQMRSAASEMRRQDAGAAAASSEKAAEALRQTEQGLRAGSSDSRQRAAGDLQLEAQQIAETQRRLAGEVSRREKDAHAGGRAPARDDALRRLAAEKDGLAERVDQLGRAARQLERDAPGAAGAPFRDAAQQLQHEQIGERMRASARQMRERAGAAPGAPPPQGQGSGQSQAQLEQQLSRALEDVVETLGGRSPNDASRLAQELDRTRGIRDRLDRLEQQVRDAEAAAQAGRAQAGAQPGAGAGQGERQSPGRSSGAGQEGTARPGIEDARAAYARELQRARETLGRLQGQPRGGAGATPEGHEFSRSAPGNEAFKQDFGSWTSLRKDIDLALEKYEATVAARLAAAPDDRRLSAGGSERVPDAYRTLVSKYFEAIAKKARQ
jgi:hypothetical protein